MKPNYILIYFFCISVNFLGQTAVPKYYFFIKQADSLWKQKEYKNAGLAFSSAFKVFGNKGYVEDRYNAARVWSLANIPDSAFVCLEKIIQKKHFTDYDKLIMEKDFLNIKSNKRWQPLINELKANKNEPAKNQNEIFDLPDKKIINNNKTDSLYGPK